jgi:hypothetical protein
MPAIFIALGGCTKDAPNEQAKGQTTMAAKADDSVKWWCKEHNRPDSQCFICHPELKEKFAAQYRAKYGKEPPLMEEEELKKEERK